MEGRKSSLGGSPPSWEQRSSKGYEICVSITILLQINTGKEIHPARPEEEAKDLASFELGPKSRIWSCRQRWKREKEMVAQKVKWQKYTGA